MARKTQYELGINCASNRENPFMEAIAEAAERRNIQWICVPKGESDRMRKRVEGGRLKIGLFLNTQADGRSASSSTMRLCRALKEAGTLVIEDPEDARFYADRGLLFSDLERNGLPVPKYFVVEYGNGNGSKLSAGRRARLGPAWVALPAKGLTRKEPRVSRARNISSALARDGFRKGERVLVHHHFTPQKDGNREYRFLVWNLLGHVIPCWAPQEGSPSKMLTVEDFEADFAARIVTLTQRVAKLSRLDWFLSEQVAVRRNGKRDLILVDPANALAGFGPGNKAVAAVPLDVLRIAADRITEAAWRRARNLTISDGTTIRCRINDPAP
jgi:hypothetical protein